MFEVTVIIPTYNRKKIFQETLSRLCLQTFPKDNYEVIVIDDYSTDGTREVLKKIDLPINFKYLLNIENLGRARTRNRGIKEAKGKYVLMIDDDIWASETLIEEHLKVHKKHNEDIVVAGAIPIAPGIPKTAINERCNDHHLWCYDEMCKVSDYLPYNFCKTANLSLPRTLFKKIGFFDETFIHYGGEDTEFGYRYSRNNIKLIFAQKAVGYHYHDETVESLISREIERGKSFFVYQKLQPEHTQNSESFFSPFYIKKFSKRSLVYNFIKFLLFTPIARYINRIFIKGINKKVFLRSFSVKYLIPILQMQYYRYGIKRVMQ